MINMSFKEKVILWLGALLIFVLIMTQNAHAGITIPAKDVPPDDTPYIWLELPTVEIPRLNIPKIELPKLDTVKTEVPRAETPKITIPKGESK